MFKKLKSIISIIFSFVKFSCIKILRFNNFKFFYIERFSPNTMVNIWKKGKMKLGKRVRVHSGSKLTVTNGGILEIGDDTTFNYNCILCSKKKIIIGNNCAFGPGVIIYDHDHDYQSKGIINGNNFKCNDIKIGNNVWIGANAIILRGSVIGDNCVIGAGSIIKGKYDANTVVYVERKMIEKQYSKK